MNKTTWLWEIFRFSVGLFSLISFAVQYIVWPEDVSSVVFWGVFVLFFLILEVERRLAFRISEMGVSRNTYLTIGGGGGGITKPEEPVEWMPSDQ